MERRNGERESDPPLRLSQHAPEHVQLGPDYWLALQLDQTLPRGGEEEAGQGGLSGKLSRKWGGDNEMPLASPCGSL